jgi:xylan 1,4-beta-xylosidase
MGEYNIPKPAFNAFAMLHRLGNQRLAIATKPDDVLATRNEDGSLVLALWNYAPPYGTGPKYTPPPSTLGPRKVIRLNLKGVPPDAAVELWQLDTDHGNVLKAFDAMGRPSHPSSEQIAELQSAGRLPAPQQLHLISGTLTVILPSQGLAVLIIRKSVATNL